MNLFCWKDLKIQLWINIMESIRRKISSLINLGSNKVCVVSLTKFYNFLKLCRLKSFSKEFNKKNVMDKFCSFLWGLEKSYMVIFLGEMNSFNTLWRALINKLFIIVYYIYTLYQFLLHCLIFSFLFYLELHFDIMK